jgi:hypothetical protein
VRGGGEEERGREIPPLGWGGGEFCGPGGEFYLQKISPPCSYNSTAGAAIINILKPPNRELTITGFLLAPPNTAIITAGVCIQKKFMTLR